MKYIMGLFNYDDDIDKTNLVKKSNQVIPNYDLYDKEISIDLYFSPEETVCIICKVDNNYLCWGSITELNDVKKNKKIFNYITDHDLTVFSNEYLALGYEKYEEIKNWYKCEMVRSNKTDTAWRTPFGHNYGETSDKQHQGQFFSGDIARYYEELKAKCTFRLMHSYKEILKSYLDILKDEVDYLKVKPLISILEKESYLRVASDKTARELYLNCIKESASLYNRHMNRVR